MSLKRRNHNSNFKLKVALSAIKEDTTIAELVSRYKISSSMIHQWKKTLLAGGADVFANSNKCNCGLSEKEAEKLYAKIGKLEIERDFLLKKF